MWPSYSADGVASVTYRIITRGYYALIQTRGGGRLAENTKECTPNVE